MNIIQAIILGVVQGLTELLPISSSAHLNLFPWLFNWGELTPSFDVALHIGTLFAILVYFYKDWINLIKGGYKQVVKKEKSVERKNVLANSICYSYSCCALFSIRQNIRKNNREFSNSV